MHFLDYYSSKHNLFYRLALNGEYSKEKVDEIILKNKIPDWATVGGIIYDEVLDRTGKRKIVLP